MTCALSTFLLCVVCSNCTYDHNAVLIIFSPGSWTDLESKIQSLIKEACDMLWPKRVQYQATPKDTPDIPQDVPVKDFLSINDDFKSLLSTIVLFLEQEPFSSVSMNLDVNFWHIHQENFDSENNEGTTLSQEIFTANGDTFQNSPIHLLFYEKITNKDCHLVPTLNGIPELSSMSFCRFKKNSVQNLDVSAYEYSLLLVLDGFTAQFVTKEQYQQLLFILGQKVNSPAANEQNYQEILQLFNPFHTSSIENFQEMISQLQFPYAYNAKKTLGQNRRDFKDFFSCLTNIRCAVIEGSHCCEAACRILQDYMLGDDIPLEQFPQTLPLTSTLFKTISTQVYYCERDGMQLNTDVLAHFKEVSKKVFVQKELIVTKTWQLFFSRVFEDINGKTGLKQLLYDKQEEFYKEDLPNKEFSNPNVKSNQIKELLHEVLTKAIFEYCPCSDLLKMCKKNKPTLEEWKECPKIWNSISSEPFQHVSEHNLVLFNTHFHLTTYFVGTKTRCRPKGTLPSNF